MRIFARAKLLLRSVPQLGSGSTKMSLRASLVAAAGASLILAAGTVHSSKSSSAREDADVVAALDEKYQAAVKENDVATMDKILADDFVLVTGTGKAYRKSDLLQEARSKSTVYEHQEDSQRTVRVWGDTAVVTARLWVKGSSDGKPVEYTLWFSDTYVRTSKGWRYVFGQASLPLPKAS